MRTLCLVHDNAGDAALTKATLVDPDYSGELWIKLEWAPSGETTVNVYDGDPDAGNPDILGGLGQGEYPDGGSIALTGPVASVELTAGTEHTYRIYSHN